MTLRLPSALRGALTIACALVMAVATCAPGEAITRSKMAALFSGPPAWLIKPAPQIQCNWGAQGCWVNGSITPASSLISDTRANSATDLLPTSPAGYAFNTYGAAVPVISPTYGHCTFQSAKNELINSNAPATQTTASLGAGLHTLWVNGTGSALASGGTATITGAAPATNGSPNVFNVTVAGTVVVTVTGSLNTFDLEDQGFGTSHIVTAGSPVTRSPDATTAIGPLAALLKSSAVTQFANTSPLAGAAAGVTAGRIGAGFNSSAAMAFNNTATQAGIFTGSFSTLASVGNSGNYGSTIVSTVSSFDGSGDSIVANFGTETTSAHVFPTITNTYLNSNNGANFMNGCVPVEAWWSSRLPAATRLALSARQVTPQQIQAFGDSLTSGNEDGLGVTYPGALGPLFSPARTTNNQGVAGNTSTQINTRFQADLPFACQGQVIVVWSGRNNFAQSATVQSDIAAMHAACPSVHFLDLSILNANSEISGSGSYNQIVALNSALSSTYGPSGYLDVRSMLVAAYNPANGADVIDHANDVPPFTLRAVDLSGTIVGAIDNVTCTFTVSPTITNGVVAAANPVSGDILTVGTEYIYLSATSGANVTGCTRGYGGTSAASYGAGQAYVGTDILHLGGAGYTLVAGWVHDKIIANGW